MTIYTPSRVHTVRAAGKRNKPTVVSSVPTIRKGLRLPIGCRLRSLMAPNKICVAEATNAPTLVTIASTRSFS
jgi:hypothetical protein